MFALLITAGLAAAGAGETLADGIEAYEALDFRRARSILKSVLESEPPKTERTRALAYLARALAVLEMPKAAEQRFVEVLTLDPAFEISWEESPRIREAFAAAQKARAVEPPLEPEAERVAATPNGGEADNPKKKPRRNRKVRGPRRVEVPVEPLLETKPKPEPGPTTEPIADEDPATATFLIIGAGVAAIGAIVAIVLFASSGDDTPEARQWQLP